jgi:hypothetical protein
MVADYTAPVLLQDRSLLSPAARQCYRQWIGAICLLRLGWTATSWQTSRSIGEASRVGKGTPQQELDLRVGTAQLITSPAGEGVVDGGIQAEQDALTFCHAFFADLASGRVSRC